MPGKTGRGVQESVSSFSTAGTGAPWQAKRKTTPSLQGVGRDRRGNSVDNAVWGLKGTLLDGTGNSAVVPRVVRGGTRPGRPGNGASLLGWYMEPRCHCHGAFGVEGNGHAFRVSGAPSLSLQDGDSMWPAGRGLRFLRPNRMGLSLTRVGLCNT